MTMRIADGGLRMDRGLRISRRRALALFTAGPVAAAMAWTPAEAEQAHEHAAQARAAAPGAAAAYKIGRAHV